MGSFSQVYSLQPLSASNSSHKGKVLVENNSDVNSEKLIHSL